MIEKIVILKPSESLNFSESINAGIRNSSNDKVFIANDDIIISKQTIERLADNCDENTISGPDSNCNYGWMTNQHYTIKGVPLLPAMLPKQIEGIVEDIYDIVPTEDNKPKEVDWLAFFATMVHRKSFEEVGLLDENFVYDKEDLDWCVRAKEKGKKFKYCYDSYCFHFGGVSRKVKHEELGMKHLEDNEKNEAYFKDKYSKKKVVGFYAHDAWEYWDENSLNGTIQDGKPKGIGGSETQAILVCRELARLGYRVKIFNKCREQHMDREGFDVEYIPFDKFGEYSKEIHYDFFIASRYLDCFDIPFSSGRNFAMVHDVFLIMNHKNPHDVKKDRIEKYFCLSNRHKQFVHEYHNIPLDQITVTSNGLDFTRFDDKVVVKNRHQMIYSSSPDRGLELLLSLFPKVKAQVPEATLDIFYGFENFKDKEYVSKLMSVIQNTPGVTYHGRVGQDELADAFLQSTIWAYPTWFQETYCITALESMISKCVPVTSDYWGLIDTVKDGGIMLPMYDDHNTVFKPEYQDRWIAECVKLLKDDDYLKDWQDKGINRVQRFTWENVAKQWDNFFLGNDWLEIQ